MSHVHLTEMQRLVALLRQYEKSARKLQSVQRRLVALLLATGDLGLTEEVLDSVETQLARAALTLQDCQDAVLLAREASDSGTRTLENEGECA